MGVETRRGSTAETLLRLVQIIKVLTADTETALIREC